MKIKIGDFLKRRKDAVDVTDGVKYKRATIRINHKGISVRDELDGTQIKTKRQFIISKGQFLLSKIDARNGAFGIVPEELNKGIITGNFWTFDVDQSKVLIDFFKSFTETVSFTDICIRSSSGTTNRKYLDEKKFLDIDIEVPNIEEQAVAISNYYQRREFINSLQNSGVNQRETLANLRQSILQEAVQGKLTEGWRANNPNTEPASELLKRIEAEKQQLIAEKKIKKEKKIPAIEDEDILDDLPNGWVWCRMGQVGNAMSSAFVDGPFGSSINTKSDYIESGVPVLRMVNVKPYLFKDDSMKYISEEKYQTFIRHGVLPGDILFSKVGAGIGEACIVPDTFEYGMLSTTGISRIRVGEIVSNNYLCHFINGHISHFKSLSQNSAQPFLNMTQIKSVPFPLAPLKEQQVIVEKVNSLMALCDELEQQIESGQIQIEQLMQSCLQEVFEH